MELRTHRAKNNFYVLVAKNTFFQTQIAYLIVKIDATNRNGGKTDIIFLNDARIQRIKVHQ